MKLVSFLNTLFKHDGFELIDSNSKKYIAINAITAPNRNAITVFIFIDFI